MEKTRNVVQVKLCSKSNLQKTEEKKRNNKSKQQQQQKQRQSTPKNTNK